MIQRGMDSRVRVTSALGIIALAFMLLAFGAQQAFAAVTDSYADGAISVSNRTAGTTSFDAASNTLSLNGVTASSIAISAKDVTIALVGDNTLTNNISASTNTRSVAITGSGQLMRKHKKDGSYFITTEKDLVIRGGKILGGAKVGGDYAQTGGSIDGSLYIKGSFSISKGTITCSGTGSDTAVEVEGNFTMSGGKIVATKAAAVYMDAIGRSFTMSGGKIASTDASQEGIFISGGNLKMSGGAISVKGTPLNAISVYSAKKKGVVYGGKIVVTSGYITAISKSDTSTAIAADSMKNPASSLKKIRGFLPDYATFKKSGNIYQLNPTNGGSAFLMKYGSKKTKVKLSRVKYGGQWYPIGGIGDGAFNTKAGHKVKSIVDTYSELIYVGSKAFYGTKKLKKLQFDLYLDYKAKYPRLLDIRCASFTKVAKDAFKKCGKSGGKGLTITIGDRGIGKKDVKVYKRFLKKHGMPGSVKFKINPRADKWYGDGHWTS